MVIFTETDVRTSNLNKDRDSSNINVGQTNSSILVDKLLTQYHLEGIVLAVPSVD